MVSLEIVALSSAHAFRETVATGAGAAAPDPIVCQHVHRDDPGELD
jgi:hypothetical protein